MQVIKITKEVYKVKDRVGTWIAKGSSFQQGNFWCAYSCNKVEDCSNDNDWGLTFKTFEEVKKFAQLHLDLHE